MKNIAIMFVMVCAFGCSDAGTSGPKEPAVKSTTDNSVPEKASGGAVNNETPTAEGGADGGSVDVEQGGSAQAGSHNTASHGGSAQGGSAPVIVPTACSKANEDCASNVCCAGSVCIKNEKGVDCADLCSSNADCASGCCANVPANGTEPSHNVCSPVNYCAAPTCNSALVGQWSEVSDGAAFDFAANGGFGFAEGVCQGGGTFICPISGNAGTVQMTITKSTNASGCIGVGVYTCQFSIVGNGMSYNCGGTALNFTRYN